MGYLINIIQNKGTLHITGEGYTKIILAVVFGFVLGSRYYRKKIEVIGGQDV